MKVSPLFNRCDAPISFSICDLNFITLEDAKKFLEINKNFTFEDIKIICYLIGIPKYINIEETIKNNYNIVFYKDEEIQWTCSKDCEKCRINPE